MGGGASSKSLIELNSLLIASATAWAADVRDWWVDGGRGSSNCEEKEDVDDNEEDEEEGMRGWRDEEDIINPSMTIEWTSYIK